MDGRLIHLRFASAQHCFSASQTLFCTSFFFFRSVKINHIHLIVLNVFLFFETLQERTALYF